MPKIPRHRLIMNQGTRVGNTTWKMNPAGSDERDCGDKKNLKKGNLLYAKGCNAFKTYLKHIQNIIISCTNPLE